MTAVRLGLVSGVKLNVTVAKRGISGLLCG
jgi:hypothetical protein